jgi:uncharacterized membrane protein
MEGVKHVKQLDDKHLHWKAEIAGKEKEWDAEITEQIPDERIAWKSRQGANNAGVVTFHRLSDSKSKVMLQMEYDPEGGLRRKRRRYGRSCEPASPRRSRAIQTVH